MTNREIAALAFKLAGLYMLVDSLQLLHTAAAYNTWRGAPDDVDVTLPVVIVLLSFAAQVALGCILLLASGRLAARMFPGDHENAPIVRVRAIQTVAFSVVGVGLITMALPTLAGVAAQLVSVASWSQVAPAATVAGVKLLLGIGLFFGGQTLAKGWSKLRYAGLRRELGLCIHCAYDLTGNTSGVCPECGTPIDTVADLRSDSTEHE